MTFHQQAHAHVWHMGNISGAHCISTVPFMYCKSDTTDGQERNEKVLGWAVDCTPRIDRNQVAARHTMYHAAETAASGSNGLTRQI